jgi:hypothetical protein
MEINMRPEITTLIDLIVASVPGCQATHAIQPIEIGLSNWKNELVLFIKPELFMVGQPDAIRRSVELVFDRLAAFEAQVHGLLVVGGAVLEEKEIMNRHYGYINRLSRMASQMLDASDRQKMADLLGLASLADFCIYGGHEYLAQHPGETTSSLDRLWFTKKSIKVRSGFYFQQYEKDGEKIILVNGFHPAQLFHFTDPSHRIVLFLVHSNTPWALLRNEMVGATFPEKAAPGSIRGRLYANPTAYGLRSVDISNNGVHLSAGPFESAFEISNFFGKILSQDLQTSTPVTLHQMVKAGFPLDQAIDALKNPPLTLNGKATDLFSATEDLDTSDAVEFFRTYLT